SARSPANPERGNASNSRNVKAVNETAPVVATALWAVFLLWTSTDVDRPQAGGYNSKFALSGPSRFVSPARFCWKHAYGAVTACLARARLEGPVLAPGALRMAERSRPVPWPGPACCSV